MTVTRLAYDSRGWWPAATRQELQALQQAGDKPGWFGSTPPPHQTPFFASGAATAAAAIAAGMPATAASRGKATTPSRLLD